MLDELEAGASIADLAAERSTDESAATNGGRGCRPARASTASPPPASRRALRSRVRRRRASTAVPGDAVGPVQTSFGWHVIEARPYDGGRRRDSSRVDEQRRRRSCGSAAFTQRTSTCDVDPRVRALGSRASTGAVGALSVTARPRRHGRRARAWRPRARHRRDAPRDRAHPAPLPAHRPAPERRPRPGRRHVRPPLRVGRPLRGRVRGDRRGARRRGRPSTARCSTRCPARRSCSSARCASLLADDRVDCDVLPAMSFLDVAWARLGIDPVEAGVRLSTATSSPPPRPGRRAPLLITHTHANWVLSDIKLAVEDATGDEPVVDPAAASARRTSRSRETTWSELDRAVEADHLTCVYVPALGVPVGAGYVRFHQLARTLREQCPWDREQTHALARAVPRRGDVRARRRARRRSTPTTRRPTRP